MHEARQEAGTEKNANTAFFVKAPTSDEELNFQKKGESELPQNQFIRCLHTNAGLTSANGHLRCCYVSTHVTDAQLPSLTKRQGEEPQGSGCSGETLNSSFAAT